MHFILLEDHAELLVRQLSILSLATALAGFDYFWFISAALQGIYGFAFRKEERAFYTECYNTYRTKQINSCFCERKDEFVSQKLKWRMKLIEG